MTETPIFADLADEYDTDPHSRSEGTIQEILERKVPTTEDLLTMYPAAADD